MESVLKQLDLPLVFTIDVGEIASLSNESVGSAVFRSDTPSVAEVTTDGNVIGRASGTAKISIDGVDDAIEIIVAPGQGSTPIPGLQSHPRIRFTQDSLDAKKRTLQDSSSTALDSSLTEAESILAEDAIAYEFEFGGLTYGYSLPHPPAQPGLQIQPAGFDDYPFWTRLSRHVEQRLTTLSLAWSLTGDLRFGNRAVEILMGVCGWRKWHEYDKATNNLSLPHFTIAASIAYDELYELLSDQQRSQVRDAIVRLGLRPMAYWFDRELDHNIAVLMNVGMLYGAIAIGDETPYVEKYLDKSISMLTWYLRQRESSTVTEGLVYTSYAMSTLLDAGAVLRRALGRTDLLDSPFVAEELSAFFAYQLAGSGDFANLSDSSHDVQPTSLMAKLSNELQDPFAGWLLQQASLGTPKLLDLPDRPNEIRTESDPVFPLDRHFERIDWVATRSGWTGEDSVAVFVSSPSAAGHNHFDQNHFVLAVNGEWLITDPGYQNYSPGPEAFFTNDSIGHNALLVNGVGQSVRGHGRVLTTEFGKEFATVTGDATAAYEGRVDRWLRTLIFARDGYLLIVDDIAASHADDQIALLFHSAAEILSKREKLSLGAIVETDPTFTIKGDRSSLNLRFWSGTSVEIAHRQYEGAERFGTWIEHELSGSSNYRTVTLLDWTSAGQRFEVTSTDIGALEIRVGNDIHHLEPANSEGVAVSSSTGERA